MILVEYGDAVEADMQRFYGLQLADYLAGRISHRRMSALLSNLPKESAFVRRARPELVSAWTTSEHLLADVANSARLRLWQAGGGKKQKPKMLRPPGVADDESERMDGAALGTDELLARLYGGGTAWEPEEVNDGS